jgi:pimeloyl-ACP methyl ester carboxylesterase
VDVVLVAGLWLDGSAWSEVVPVLEGLGHRPVAVTLPGQGDGSTTATLDDQRDAVVAAVDAADGPVVVVGHSAASTLAWMAADARPDKVVRVVLIGGFPSGDGDPYFREVDGEVLEFPGWEEFEGPDAADLGEAQRAEIESRMVPVPAAVVGGTVRLSNERRFDVPVSVICPEFTPAQAASWVDSGEVPELARARHVEYLDLDSGHWPMFSCPIELGHVLGHPGGT